MGKKKAEAAIENASIAAVDKLYRHPEDGKTAYTYFLEDAPILKKRTRSIGTLKNLLWICIAIAIFSIPASFIPGVLTGLIAAVFVTIALLVQTSQRSFIRAYGLRRVNEIHAERHNQLEAVQRQYEEDMRTYHAAMRDYHAAMRANLTAWQQQHPLPPPQPYGVSHNGAEVWVRDWLEAMGVEGATVTQQSGDGGIDVTSYFYIAQVKHYTGSVGINEVREMVGVVAADQHQRIGLFFTSGQYPASALELAEKVNLALFQYDVTTATVNPVNDLASRLHTRGFHPQWWPTA